MENKIVSLKDKMKELSSKKEDKLEEDESLSFEEIMKRNKENEDRLRKERAQANKSVLRSYRIK